MTNALHQGGSSQGGSTNTCLIKLVFDTQVIMMIIFSSLCPTNVNLMFVNRNIIKANNSPSTNFSLHNSQHMF